MRTTDNAISPLPVNLQNNLHGHQGAAQSLLACVLRVESASRHSSAYRHVVATQIRKQGLELTARRSKR